MQATPVIYFHLIAALMAVPLGAYVLARVKGDALHKALGRIWFALMAAVALSSFWITTLSPGHFSWIHGLSVFSLFCLVAAFIAIRKGRVETHRSFLIGTYLGLLGAGAGTLLPGRLLHQWLFG